MTWRTKLQPASFRGAGFLVEAADVDVGRRLAIHEYPLRDLPYAEDMGRKARVYSFAAFVVGDDYMAARDALIAACEEKGVGTLVHPYYGSLEVICQVCGPKEENAKGRMARFNLTFLEAGQRSYPAEDQDFSDQAADDADTLDSVAGDVFAQTYRLSGPAWLKAAAAGDLTTALQLVTDVANAMPSLLDSQAAGEFLDWLEGAADSAGETVEQGAEAVEETVTQAVEGVAEVAEEEDALEALLAISTFGAPNDETSTVSSAGLESVTATTATRQTQADNQEALTALVRRLALSTGTQAALAAEYANHDKGQEARDALLTRLDDEMQLAGDSGQDAAYQALRALYASAAQAFAAKLKTLARVRALAPMAVPRPVLALAYDLYGDLGRADQIVALNNIVHPGLPPGGESFKVLSE